ncbi:MAG: hypothetical protein AAGC46_07520, partial [Solirubrobacteraceae bacterium]
MRPAPMPARRDAAGPLAEDSPTVHDHRLSRRTMLQASGYGALVLTLPLAAGATASVAEAAAVPASLRRASYLGLVGETFAVDSGGSLTLE